MSDPNLQSAAPQRPANEAAPDAAGLGRRDLIGNGLKLASGAVVFFLAEEAMAQGEGAAAAQPAPAAAPAAAATPGGRPVLPETYNPAEHRWAYLIDTHKCIGCGSCVRACKAENDVPDGYFRTWVERYLISPEGGTYVDSPSGGINGFGPAAAPFTPTKAFFVPKMCNHCAATPCVQVCPVGASYISKDGVVMVDAQRCIGCGYCVQACPFGSRFLNERTHTAEKCTWCYHRITKGMKPTCVEVCPTGTRQFGDMKHEGDPVRDQIEHERVQVLQPNLLTEPQCYYLGIDKEVR